MEPQWVVEDYHWDAQELQATQRARAPSSEANCQVEGCPHDLMGLRPFYQRLRICEEHAKAHSITNSSGVVVRFCQQCSKLQPIDMFEGDRRSCITSLDKRRARRTVGGTSRPRAHAAAGASPAAEGDMMLGRRKRQASIRLHDSSSGSGSGSGSAASSGQHVAMAGGAAKRRPSPGGTRSPGSMGEAEQGSGNGSPRPPAPPSHPAAAEQSMAAARELLVAWQAPPGVGSAPHLLAASHGRSGDGVGGTAAPGPLGPLAGSVQFSQTPAAGSATVQQLAAQQQHAVGGLGGPVSANDVDWLLQMAPEDLADCLLGIHGPNLAQNALEDVLEDVLDVGLPPGAAVGPAPMLPPGVVPAPASPEQGQSAGSGVGSVVDTCVLPVLEAQPSTLGAPLPVGAPYGGSGSLPGHSGGLPGHGSNSPGATAHTASAGYYQASQQALQAAAGEANALVTLAFKLFGSTPDNLPPALRSQLESALALSPSVMTASIRTGCVCITASLLLSRAEQERLAGNGAGGLAGAAAAALAAALPDTKVLCQAGSQVSAAHGASGKQEHLTLAAGSAGMHLAAPQLVTPSVVLCADGSRAVQLVLAGPGLASLGAVLHCRSRGRHQIVTVLRVRRGLPSALAARLAHAAEDEGQANAAEAPDTPSSADRISPHREAEAGSKPPRHGAEGPSSCLAARHARPPPTEAEHAFERLELPPGQDAVLVQLAAPAAGWGLLELELASGPVLSAATPLLLLPSWAEDAAAELASLAGADIMAGLDAAAFLRNTGFLLHTAERQAQPHAQPLHPAAAQRVTGLARQLGIACASRGWMATACLLVPAMGLGREAADAGASSSNAASKGHAPGSVAAAAAMAASKGASEEEREALGTLLASLALQDEDEDEGGQGCATPQRSLRAEMAADWFWAGANLAAGAASLALLLRYALG